MPPALSRKAPSPDQAALAGLGRKVRARLAADASVYTFPTKQAEMFAVADFLSEPECARLIGMIDAVARPSSVYTPDHAIYRTSSSGDVDPHDSFVLMIERRICDLMGIPQPWSETFQGQRYRPGEEFQSHYDWYDTKAEWWQQEARRAGQRSWTAMCWLNTVEEGGETSFPRLGMAFPPQPGMLLMWNNMLPDGRPNEDTIHAGLPVISGVKYIITKWFRTRPWR